MSLVDVAWVLFEDPDPDTKVHRVSLTTGRLVCADWVTEGAGYRIPDNNINQYGPRCGHCWTTQENP